ncbi:MAG: glycerophosphodiester phosphodiesterase [Chlorobiota bacterium]
MMTLKEFVTKGNRFIIAHRGASGTMVENTMPAFEKAVEHGAKAIEVDVQVSKDKIPFAYHDTSLGGKFSNRETRELSSLELDQINLNESQENKIHIPKLDEIVRFAKRNEIYLVIEIKPDDENNIILEDIDFILDCVNSFGYRENCLFASFSTDAIKYIKNKNKHYHTAAISLGQESIEYLKNDTECDVYICSMEELNEEVVNTCKELGLYLGVYSADNEEDLDYILKFGINAIVTNYPELISELLAARDNS